MIAPGAYDRAITIFSPDGRLFQVEYALEMVKRGSTIVGIKCPEGVTLAAMEKKGDELVDLDFSWKIFEVDTHVGSAVAGLSSDAQKLIDQARIYAQSNKLMYDEPIDVEAVAKRIGGLMQMYTQHGGVRPFGVSLIFAGVDKSGVRLFATDPSGSYRGYQATTIGVGSDDAKSILKKKYKPAMKLDEIIALAIECVSKGEKVSPQDIDVMVIDSKTKKLRKLATEEVAKHLR